MNRSRIAARDLRVVGAALALGVVLLALRSQPLTHGDQGVFLSIAARMLRGDHLYAQVIDNKDPLFFYTYAGALWVGGWRAPFALDGIWLAVAAISACLLTRELRAPRAGVVASFFLYPLALTLGWYEPGLAVLGALAFAPLVPFFWLRSRFLAAGAMLAVVALFNISVIPVAGAPVLALLILRVPDGSIVRQVARAAVGAAGIVAVVTAVLAVRGELGGYLYVLHFDFYYKDSGLAGRGKPPGVRGHLDVVYNYLGTGQTVLAVVVVSVFLFGAWRLWRRADRPFRLLVAAAGLTLLATLATLATTAIWPHHLQILAFAVALVGVGLVSIASEGYGTRAATVVAILGVVFLAGASTKTDIRNGLDTSAWTSPPDRVTSDALEAAKQRYYSGRNRVTFMDFGQNTENASAVFVDHSFSLSCRRFHQYPHDPPGQLAETLTCVSKRKPDLLLVTPSLFDLPNDTPQWTSFVSGAERLLRTSYTRVSDVAGNQVWKLKA